MCPFVILMTIEMTCKSTSYQYHLSVVSKKLKSYHNLPVIITRRHLRMLKWCNFVESWSTFGYLFSSLFEPVGLKESHSTFIFIQVEYSWSYNSRSLILFLIEEVLVCERDESGWGWSGREWAAQLQKMFLPRRDCFTIRFDPLLFFSRKIPAPINKNRG